MNLLEDEVLSPSKKLEKSLIEKKIEDSKTKYSFLKFRADCFRQKQNTSVDDLPPDPLIKRTVIPIKKARFVNLRKYL